MDPLPDSYLNWNCHQANENNVAGRIRYQTNNGNRRNFFNNNDKFSSQVNTRTNTNRTTHRGGRDGYSSDFNGNRGGHYHPYQRHNNYQHADLRHRLDTLVPGQNIINVREQDDFEYSSNEPRYTKTATQALRNRLIRNVNKCRLSRIHKIINNSPQRSDNIPDTFEGGWKSFIDNSTSLLAISD